MNPTCVLVALRARVSDLRAIALAASPLERIELTGQILRLETMRQLIELELEAPTGNLARALGEAADLVGMDLAPARRRA